MKSSYYKLINLWRKAGQRYIVSGGVIKLLSNCSHDANCAYIAAVLTLYDEVKKDTVIIRYYGLTVEVQEKVNAF